MLTTAATLGVLTWACFSAGARRAEAEPARSATKSPATCQCETGLLLQRAAPGKSWRIVAKGEAVPPDQTLLGLPGAIVRTTSGSVDVLFQTDLSGNSPYPVHECALVLHANARADLDFTLRRGRVDLINRKKEGTAHVRLGVRQETFELDLEGAGARVALELYGRWPRGMPFHKVPGPKEAPTADLVVLVVSGEATLKNHGVLYALTAPPGPSLIEWDSVLGLDGTAHRLEKLPDWAAPADADSPLVRTKKERIERFRQAIVAKSLDQVLEQLLASDNPDNRRAGVWALAALDDLPRLGQALREAKHPDVWNEGVLALRHWIGRDPGQDQILYRALIQTGKYTAVDAETTLELLHSFSEADCARPETYGMLIDYLGHDKLAIRGLAYWHLSRLAPAGREFGYDPMAPKEERDKAIQKWKRLIPAGQVPPRLKSGTSK